MRSCIYSAPVADVVGALSPETDLRSAEFCHAVLLRAMDSGSLEIETDEAEIAAVQQSFVAFVRLCERKEQETGEPVTIQASW